MAKKKIGRWQNFSGANMRKFDKALAEILEEYSDEVFYATEDGLDDAEKILKDNLKANTPRDTGDFIKSWRGKGKKYKLKRYVGTSRTVLGKNGEKISLANIYEYSTNRGNPFIQSTVDNSANEMINAIVNKIKNI